MHTNSIYSIILSVALLFPGFAHARQVLTFFVATNGNSANPGTQSSPFRTLDDARHAIANIKGPIDATVYLREGIYRLSKSFIIAETAPDPSRHIRFSNYQQEAVSLTGSQRLDNHSFHLVSDPAILSRLPAVARGKVLQADLQESNITDYGKRARHGYKEIFPAPLELFYDRMPLTVARWPNSGLLPIGTVLDPGSSLRAGGKDYRGGKFVYNDARMNNWKQADNAWVGGYFSYGYADDYMQVEAFDLNDHTIQLKQPAVYSMFSSDNTSTAELKNGQKIRGFYVYNLLEEIDEPGEWFLDEKTHLLYLWPPDNAIGTADIEVSILEDPIVVLSQTGNIRFTGIAFACSRGMGLLAENTKHVTIDHCTFEDLGTVAVSTGTQLNKATVKYQAQPLSGPDAALKNTDLQILSCTIRHTGSGGIVLDGGDRVTLNAAHNSIDNCEISDFSRLNRSFSPGVSLNGVGNQVSHCFIHDAPDMAIIFYGNNHLISFNHIQNVAGYGTDATAVGTGGDITSTGTTISNNFFDHILSPLNTSIAALYLDDGSSGMEVDGNIFYQAGTSGSYHFGAIHVNGGSNNHFRNNYFIDCNQAFSNSQWPDAQWRSYLTNPAKEKIFSTSRYTHAPAFIQAYPWLAALTDSNDIAPRQNYTYNTLAYHVNIFSSGSSFVHENTLMTSQDPGFADAANGNFTLLKTPTAFAGAGDWKPVPFAGIGPRSNP